jgi:NTP pyrophosphatase (non-canonical NTP hydrolase)
MAPAAQSSFPAADFPDSWPVFRAGPAGGWYEGVVEIRAAQRLVDENKREKGFSRDVPIEICLLQGELTEFFQAWRRGEDGVGEELADVMIFVLGLAGILDIDLDSEVEAKIAKNAARRYVTGPNGTLVKAAVSQMPSD